MTNKMPNEIWVRPSRWGTYLFTPDSAAGTKEDTQYIRKDHILEVIEGMREALIYCARGEAQRSPFDQADRIIAQQALGEREGGA